MNLNQLPDRIGTNSVKWEYRAIDGSFIPVPYFNPNLGEDQVLPLWVADMDFKSPQSVIDAIQERASHGIYGYTVPPASFFEAIQAWTKNRYGWEIESDWIDVTQGIVPTLNLLVQTFTQPGDRVLIQRPVYHPFTYCIENNGREVVSNSLRYEEASRHYAVDFDDLAEKAADPKVTMALLCSPHNPTTRVWSKSELKRMGDILIDNGVFVISDEIHADLIYDDHRFISFAGMGEKYAQNSLTTIAASKTFNLAGFKTSIVITPNETYRAKFSEALTNQGIYGINCFGQVATEVAYRTGEEWLEEVMTYIQANYAHLEARLAAECRSIRPVKPEGTYLVWIDFRQFGLSQVDLNTKLMEESKLFMNDGEMFGEEGVGFMRMNIACPRFMIDQAVDRLVETFG